MGYPSISIRVNPLFLLLLLIYSLLGMFKEVIIAFTFVFLHEFIHLLVAYKSGYKVTKIEFLPFGGLAEYADLLEMEPWQEVKVALSGPLFNLILAGLLYIFFFLNSCSISNFWQLIINYNLILGLFNLLPALPLDGGRVLRAFLVYNFGFQRGTMMAIKFAKIMAIFGYILGIIFLVLKISNLWILFLSFFVYGAVLKEEKQFIYLLLRYLIHREEIVKEYRIKPVLTQVVRGHVLLKEVVYYINPVNYNLFYVLNNNLKLVGIISETELLNSFFKLESKDKKIIELITN